jgi:hypothetical protein
MQKQYVEKPRKVLAEPYDPAATPDQRGVCRCVVPGLLDGTPHAHPPTGPWILHADDMITYDAVFPDRLLAVYTLAEFEAMYGNVPTLAEGA